MNLRKLLILILLLCSTALLADDEDWFLDKPIKDLTFIGLEAISVNELKPIVRDYIGKPFSMELFWEVQGKLLELEYFEDIIANAREGEPERTSVIIEFQVIERPSVDSVTITGNKKLSTAELLDVIGVKAGDFINETQLKIDENSIVNLYLEKGFRNVTATSRSEINATDNRAAVYFDLTEGYKATIAAIDFSGNDFAAASTLRGKLKHKKQSLFETGVFQESYLAEDKANIIKYYHEHGYIDVEVAKIDRTVEDNEEKARSYISLVYYINEGAQYTFGNISVEGNQIFTEKEILALVRQNKGKEFNQVKFEEDYQKIVTLYTDSGYIFNTIQQLPTRDEKNKIIDYKIMIIERDKAHLGSITLEGNTKTKDHVIFRELPFEVGDIFSTEKLRDGYLNLYNLQYFSDIAYNPVPSDIDGLMDLVISVEEQSVADIKFGMAFSGGDFPISGQLGWADKNFLGKGQNFGIDLEFSNVKQVLGVNFQDNYLFGKGWGGGASLSLTHTEVRNAYQDIIAPIFTDEDVPDPFTSLEEYNALKNDLKPTSTMNYHAIDISLALNTGYFYRTAIGKLGVNTKLATTPRYLLYDDSEFRHFEQATRDNLRKWVFINTWANTFYLDKRDIYYNPESGFLLQQDVKFAGGFLFGSRDYIKLLSKAEGFFTLWDKPVWGGWNWQGVLALHGAMAFMLPQFGSNQIFNATEMEKLYVDGMNTGRGHAPVMDGEAMLDFSLELRSPILKQYIWGSLFFDAVALWQERADFNMNIPEDFRFSIGAGLRLTIPGMPLRLYIAQPFLYNAVDGFQLVEGDFTLGNAEGFHLSPKIVISITPPGGF